MAVYPAKPIIVDQGLMLMEGLTTCAFCAAQINPEALSTGERVQLAGVLLQAWTAFQQKGHHQETSQCALLPAHSSLLFTPDALVAWHTLGILQEPPTMAYSIASVEMARGCAAAVRGSGRLRALSMHASCAQGGTLDRRCCVCTGCERRRTHTTRRRRRPWPRPAR